VSERDHTFDKSTIFGSARVVALLACGAGVGGAPCVETWYSGLPAGSDGCGEPVLQRRDVGVAVAHGVAGQ